MQHQRASSQELGESLMNRQKWQYTIVVKLWCSALYVLYVLCIALVFLTLCSANAQSQTVRSASSNDDEYTKQIREYTTESFFSTNLVDHLPASSTVPSPAKILGHIVGAPDSLTYSKDIYHYYDELAKASPRIRVFRVG